MYQQKVVLTGRQRTLAIWLQRRTLGISRHWLAWANLFWGALFDFGSNLAENSSDWSAALGPGEEASLYAIFDTLFHGPDATGSFKRMVSVISNDPLNARQDVSFVIEVTE